MIIGVTLIINTLLYSIILVIVYYKKPRINSFENKIYSILVRMNVFGLILELLCTYFVYAKDLSSLNTLLCIIFNRTFILYLLSWEMLFTLYIFFVSFNDNATLKKRINGNFKRLKTIVAIACIIIFSLTLSLPLEYFNDGNYVYSYGPATDLLVIVGGLFIMCDMFCVFKNIKHINNKKYIPLLVLIIAMVFVLVVRIMKPGIVLINSTFAFVTVIMYFTIENPDVQIMEELYKNKKLIEKSSEDTSNFLFRMTQDIKKPIQEIINVSYAILERDDIEEIKEGNKFINNKAKELDYFVNDALDISSMSTKTIKVFNTRYNPATLFSEIKYIVENKLNQNVNFEFNVARTLPSYLYGDFIKLKQAISSVLDNAVKHTKEGFISLNVETIIKYDICRLLITISDSGEGMSIDEVNNILSLNIDELSKIKLTDEKKSYNLKEVKKLTMYLGGNLIVNSEPNKGTTVSITIDQKIVETKNIELSKKLDLYEQSLHTNKKIMVVDDDVKELAKITSKLEKMNADVSGSLFGRDVIEKISNKQKFNLIILDDETSTYSGLEVLKELKKNPKFNTPVVIMIDDRKEFIKLEYLKDGFSDVILKSKLTSELERIMERF